ncbi:hypothetical protein EON83_10085 [bacterium]|nr:MAG: hypothetical protein EON83_10085 [bacterium]
MGEEETRAFMAWEARVKRIWGVEVFSPDLLELDDTRTLHLFHFPYPGHDDVNVQIFAFVDSIGIMMLHTPDISVYWEDGLFVLDNNAPPLDVRLLRDDPRAAPWWPILRRACWLCNLPIEATAHEKEAWMHGLSREEIEAWDLKI